MCKTIYRIGCLLLLLLYVASLQSFAEMQPLDGSITRTGGTADCAWYYSSDAVTIGGKQFSGHGYVVDNHGDRAEGAITFDISGWERFTAVAGLKNEWHGQDGKLTIAVDGKQQFTRQLRAGEAGVAVDIALMGNKSLTISMVPSMLLAQTLFFKPAILNVNSTPAGASVLINGVNSWKTTPCTLTLPLGNETQKQVTLTLTSVGYDTIKQTLTVFSGTNPDCVMTLTRSPAILNVNSTPTGASVLIDGVDSRQTTPCTLTIPLGNDTQKQVILTLTSVGYDIIKQSLTVRSGTNPDCVMTLTRPPATFNVNSTPAGASVLINGDNSWKTTPCTLTLPLGNETQKQVTLTLTSVGYDTIKQTLTVFSGTNPDCMMTLTRPPAILSVNSTPTGASVLIDGVDSRKTTPCTLTIPLGNDTQKHVVLTLTSVGYDTIKQTLTVRSGTNPYCVMTLTRLPAILLITTTPAGVTVMGNEIPFDQVTPCTLTFPMDKETKKQITLQLTLHEHETFTYTLTIHPADNLTLNYNMLKQVKVEKYNPNPIDGAALVWVPGSTLTMGSSDGVGQKDERPAHLVTMTGYWIYKYEVTVAQYRTFCAATHRKLPVFPTGYSWQGKRGWYDRALQQHPIVNVSWDDAQAYADWAEVALPTEAQWEYAARGPKGRNYPWGGTATANDPKNGWDETKCANGNNSYNVGKSTWPVGRFPAGASWCGAHDMAGNVWEWCADWLGDYPVTTAVTNPTGPATGKYRVVRGGSWGSGEFSLRSVGRIGDGPGGWGSGDIGFRCVSPSP